MRPSAISFLVEYDPTRLSFDPAILAGTQLQNAQVQLPAGFRASTYFVPSSGGGRIGITIYDPLPPIDALPDGVLATLRFSVLEESGAFAAVRISDSNPPSASDAMQRKLAFETSLSGGITVSPLRARLASPQQALDFGAVALKERVEKNLVISNVGNRPLTVAAVAIESEGSAFYLIDLPIVPREVAADGAFTVRVGFLSNDPGNFSGRLRIETQHAAEEISSIPLFASAVREGTTFYTTKRVIPAVARLSGGGGSEWRSKLTLYNDAPAPVDVRLTLLATGSTPRRELTFAVGPQESLTTDDLVSVFEVNGSVTTAMIIEASRPDLVATSATFNARADGGQAGQTVPVIDWSRLARTGERLLLVGLERSANQRTNVGIVNFSSHSVEIEAALRNGKGDVIRRKLYGLKAGESRPGIDIFDGLANPDARDLSIILTTVTPDTVFFGYASTVDNKSGSPVFQSPR